MMVGWILAWLRTQPKTAPTRLNWFSLHLPLYCPKLTKHLSEAESTALPVAGRPFNRAVGQKAVGVGLGKIGLCESKRIIYSYFVIDYDGNKKPRREPRLPSHPAKIGTVAG